jgi:hypothetical protein
MFSAAGQIGRDRGVLPSLPPPPEGIHRNPRRGDSKSDRAVRGKLPEQGDNHGHIRHREE